VVQQRAEGFGPDGHLGVEPPATGRIEPGPRRFGRGGNRHGQ
jgi:hypothetical protein